MVTPNEHVMDLIFGRWRSQTLYAGVELGVFEVVETDPTPANKIADAIDVDQELEYSPTSTTATSSRCSSARASP